MKYQIECWHCGGEGVIDGACTCENIVDICDCLEPELPVCRECQGKGHYVVSQLTEDNCDTAVPIWEPDDGRARR